jgi:hypothetical protein
VLLRQAYAGLPEPAPYSAGTFSHRRARPSRSSHRPAVVAATSRIPPGRGNERSGHPYLSARYGDIEISRQVTGDRDARRRAQVKRRLRYSVAAAVAGVLLASTLLSISVTSVQRTWSATPTGSLDAIGVTQPAGALWIGSHLWVSDQVQGFCRIDAPATAQPGATVYDPASPDYCYLGNTIPGLVTGGGGEGGGGNIGFVPAQAAFDPRPTCTRSSGARCNYIYIPDRSNQSLGIWRAVYEPDGDPAAVPPVPPQSIVPGSGLVLAPLGGLQALKTTSAALGPDGNLYVGAFGTGNISRVPSPESPVETQVVQTIGVSVGARHVYSMVFVGRDLYVADSVGLGVIRNAPACVTGCQAVAVAGFPAAETTALATDGADMLYVAQPPDLVYSGHISTGSAAVLASVGLLPAGQTFPISVFPNSNCVSTSCPFSFPAGQSSGLSLDPLGSLYVGDDPGPSFIQRGRVWTIGSAAPCADADGDGICDIVDNCLSVANADQRNTDAAPLVTAGLVANDTSVPNGDKLGDACDADIDNDGLSNADEAALGPGGASHNLCPSASAATSPLLFDSDGDRVGDRAECALGTDPMNAASKPPARPAGDTDGDGLPDALEIAIGSNPNVVDTDGDHIADGIEFKGYNTSPLLTDTDGDGCADGKEIGSVNADKTVNSTDLLIVAKHLAGATTSLAMVDVNKDGVVNSTDLLIVAKNMGAFVC